MTRKKTAEQKKQEALALISEKTKEIKKLINEVKVLATSNGIELAYGFDQDPDSYGDGAMTEREWDDSGCSDQDWDSSDC